jgi:hypothetical protein
MPEPETADALQEEAEIGKIRHPEKRSFLTAIANTCSIVRAAAIAETDRDNPYIWLKEDPQYAAAFEIARNRGADAREAEAVRRAFEGVTKPVFHAGKRAIDVGQNPDGSITRDAAGKPVGIPAAVREYSDVLLIFLLKGRNPAVFPESGVKVATFRVGGVSSCGSSPTCHWPTPVHRRLPEPQDGAILRPSQFPR